MNHSKDQEAIKNLGLNLKKAREARGWTKEKLADKADTAVSQIYRIENGKIDPHYTTIARLASVLGMEVWELVKGE